MNDQEHKDFDDHRDHQENQENQPQSNADSPLKKVAMAAFGALSSAAQSIANVIGDASSPENLDKYAKKGEESMAGIKDAGGELVKQVKDFGTQTFQKVKGSIKAPDLAEYKDIESSKKALADEFKSLAKLVQLAQKRLDESSADEEGLIAYQDMLSHDLQEHSTRIDGLFHRLIKLQKEDVSAEAEDISETAHVDQPSDSEVPYDTQSYPRSVYDRREHGPADYEKASPVAPDKDNNTVVLETDSRNDHLEQNWPPPMG